MARSSQECIQVRSQESTTAHAAGGAAAAPAQLPDCVHSGSGTFQAMTTPSQPLRAVSTNSRHNSSRNTRNSVKANLFGFKQKKQIKDTI